MSKGEIFSRKTSDRTYSNRSDNFFIGQAQMNSNAGSFYDKDLYGKGESGQFQTYIQTEEDEGEQQIPSSKSRFQYTGHKHLIDSEMKSGPKEETLPMAKKIAEREDKYLQRKRQRMISPERHDPFKDMDKTPDINSRTYGDIMAEQKLENERQDIMMKI